MIATTLLLALLGWAPGPASTDPSAPPVEDPVEDPIEVRAPEQVEAEAELRTPEQVRDAPAPIPQTSPTPTAPPPDPKAHPSEGVYAVGSGPLAPLPPPPPPVPASAIPKFDWRGRMWLAIRLSVTGPIAGSYPAKPSVVALGGLIEGGWRINQIAALGTSLGRQPHERIQFATVDATIIQRGTMSTWDIAFIRLFAPVRGRVDPFLDLGGGLAFLEPAREGLPLALGGSVRASLGFDAWIAKNLSLGVAGLYRATLVDASVGHTLQGIVDLSVHF